MTEGAVNKSVKPSVADDQPLVSRSVVPIGRQYGDYRQALRHDFYYMCAYCTITEYEAQGLSFEIDHYEPVRNRPDLKNDYENLMYACDTCNGRKTDISPPEEASVDGYRFFKVDRDIWVDHYMADGQRILHRTAVGEFTIDNLHLNRLALRRLREIRSNLIKFDQYAVRGIEALRNFPIDQLPKEMKGRASAAIASLAHIADNTASEIDFVLKSSAHSYLLDEDPEKAKFLEDRRTALDELGVLYPGAWRRSRK